VTVTESGRRERRILLSALALVVACLGGLALGAAVSPPDATRALAVPALALQTLVTVGGLPRRERALGPRPGLLLLGLHHALATVPLAIAGLAVGLDDPLGFGIFLIAAAPPAALIPAYADVAEIYAGNLLAFVLGGYALALVLTPALVYVAAGEVVGVGPIALTLGAGLIAPTLVGRALHTPIARIPTRARRGVVNAAVLLISFALGGGLSEGVGSSAVTLPAAALVFLLLVVRAVAAGAIARRVAPSALAAEAPFAVGFKNAALSAATGGSLVGAAAAVPGLLAFPVDVFYFLLLARRRARGTGDEGLR
jgi:hypothetical protein